MFNVGDTVRIKDNFNEYRYPNDPGINDQMLELVGTEDTIVRCFTKENEKRYILMNGWQWIDEWLEPVYENIEIEENDLMKIFEE